MVRPLDLVKGWPRPQHRRLDDGLARRLADASEILEVRDGEIVGAEVIFEPERVRMAMVRSHQDE
jgi:hypothetical protein